MLNEEGLVFDDGVSFRMDEDCYLLSCSTGGALAVERKLDKLINVECSELDVLMTPVTSQWVNATVCGPLARQMLETTDSTINWTLDALPFMHMQKGTIAGMPTRVFRVSFTGELSFEINVPSRYGLKLWEYLMDIGKSGISARSVRRPITYCVLKKVSCRWPTKSMVRLIRLIWDSVGLSVARKRILSVSVQCRFAALTSRNARN